MVGKNNFKKVLHRGEVVFGLFLKIIDPAVAEIIRFDSFWVLLGIQYLAFSVGVGILYNASKNIVNKLKVKLLQKFFIKIFI